MYIPDMVKSFDDHAANHFIEGIKQNELLLRRIQAPAKLRRLRVIGNIVLEKVSEAFQDKRFLEALCDEGREEEFFDLVRNKT